MNDAECQFCDKLLAAWIGKDPRSGMICCESCVIHVSLDAAKMGLTTGQNDPAFVAERTAEIEVAKKRLPRQSKRGREEDE